MKRFLSENYGKRAYVELQDIKQKNALQKKVFNRCNNYKSLIFAINDSSKTIVKEVDIKANKSIANVNIYTYNDINYNNIKFKLYNNNVLIYGGRLINCSFELPFNLDNLITIIIDNPDEVLVDFSIEFESDVKDNTYDLFEELDGVIYRARSGLGETIITTYLSIQDLIDDNYESVFNVPIQCVDFKLVRDNRLFTGSIIMLIGIDDIGYLKYAVSADNFNTQNTLIESSDIAKIDCEKNELLIYYVKNNKLNIISFNENFETNISECNLGNNYCIVDIYTPTTTYAVSTSMSHLAFKCSDKSMYLIVHTSQLNSIDNFVVKYIGKADDVNMCITSLGHLYVFMREGFDITENIVTYNSSLAKISISNNNDYFPCSKVQLVAGEILKIYKNNVVFIGGND